MKSAVSTPPTADAAVCVVVVNVVFLLRAAAAAAAAAATVVDAVADFGSADTVAAATIETQYGTQPPTSPRHQGRRRRRLSRCSLNAERAPAKANGCKRRWANRGGNCD